MSVIDWYILLAYFLLVLLIGSWAGSKTQNVSEYFLAGRSFGVWIAALSLIATETSAATVIGAPDTSFRGDLSFLQTTMGAVCSRFVVSFYFLNVYYRAKVVTVYEYLASRYGTRTQSFVACVFCVGRLLASGARLYIAAFAVATLTEFSLFSSLLGIATLAILYGTFGGLRAVVWTDCVQGVLFLTVSLFSLLFVVREVGGIEQLYMLAEASGKLKVFDFSLDLGSAEFWQNPYTFLGGFLGGFLLGLATHGTDQDMVQRMLACRSAQTSQRSMLLVALLEIPVTLLYVGLGLALWVFFQSQGVSGPGESESVFPYFVANYVPQGFLGLFLAALLAAAMSSVDSALNSLATVSLTDIYRPLRNAGYFPKASSEMPFEVMLSKFLSFVWGLALVLVALWIGSAHQELLLQDDAVLATSRNKELLSVALGIMGLVYGPLLAVFVLALASKRGSSTSVILGMCGGVILVGALKYYWPNIVGWTWHLVIGFLCTLLLGSLGSFGKDGEALDTSSPPY